MLDLAPQRGQARRTNVEFRKGYLEACLYPTPRVDVIISNCVVNLSPDKPGLSRGFSGPATRGRLAISDVVIDGDLSICR